MIVSIQIFLKGHRKRNNKRERKDKKQKKDPERTEVVNKEETRSQSSERSLKYVDAPLPKTNPWKIKNSDESQEPLKKDVSKLTIFKVIFWL
jgi:hypothetical protein